MTKNNTNGIFFQRFFKNYSWVGNSPGNAATGYDFKMIDLVCTIKKHNGKHFMMMIPQDYLKIIGNFPTVFYNGSCFHHSSSKCFERLAGIELILGNGCPALNLGYVYPSEEE